MYHNKIHYKYILDVDGVNVICIEKKYKLSLLFLWKLVRFIRKNKIDIIHSYKHNTNVWARIAGKLSSCRIIISSIRTTNLSSKWYLMERFLKKWTTQVITNSYTAKKEYLTNINVPRADFITVIQNGIDLDAIANFPFLPPKESRLKYNIQKDDFVIVHVAGIDRNKNQLCLLKAIKSIDTNNLKILFVGRTREKMYYQELQDYVRRYHLENNVLFLGEQQNVFSIMSIADLLVLTSLRDAFPNVIMEAMSVGLPVISSDVGDIRYLVKNGVNGFLFPNDNHHSLSELIVKIISLDVNTRKQMERAGRDIIEANYTIEKMVRKTESLYEKFINGCYNRSNDINIPSFGKTLVR